MQPGSVKRFPHWTSWNALFPCCSMLTIFARYWNPRRLYGGLSKAELRFDATSTCMGSSGFLRSLDINGFQMNIVNVITSWGLRVPQELRTTCYSDEISKNTNPCSEVLEPWLVLIQLIVYGKQCEEYRVLKLFMLDQKHRLQITHNRTGVRIWTKYGSCEECHEFEVRSGCWKTNKRVNLWATTLFGKEGQWFPWNLTSKALCLHLRTNIFFRKLFWN